MTRHGRPISSDASATPYRLLALCKRYGVAQRAIGDRLRFRRGARAGQQVSAATISKLLTRRIWPITLDRVDIEAVAAEVLREHGVPAAEIETAWVIDGEVEAQANPSNPRAAQQEANPEPCEAPFELPEAEMLSPQARQHFGLARHPFVDDVQGPQDVYLSREQRYIRESMYYAAKHAGFVAVVGESGSGKTTLRRDLIDRIRRDNEPILVIQPQTIDKKVLTAAHICDAVIADLSNERPRLSLEAKSRQVQRLLAGSARGGNAHVLIIEEAHDLAVRTLKYLKRFWELEDGFKKLMGVVLIGQPELGDLLDERRNHDALREVIRRCEVAHLRPLNGGLEEYLALKFRRVGADPKDIFEGRDIYDAMRNRLTRHRVGTNEVESQVYPLSVQNLVVKCMNAAVELGLPKINAQLIGRV